MRRIHKSEKSETKVYQWLLKKKKKKKYINEIGDYYGCLGLIFSIVYS